MFKPFLIFSILAHLILVASLHEVAEQETEELVKQSGGEDEEEKSSISFNIKKYEENADIDCIDYYVGIGVIMNFMRQIIEIAKDSPAERAKLQLGDALLTNLDIKNLKPKQEITVDILRKGELLSFQVTVDKICTGASHD
jgi:predicted metalloprotease with PDZ domain